MKRFIQTLIPLVLLVSGSQLAEAQKSWDEIEYPEINNFEKPDVEIFDLDNGIRFYLVEDHELPLINIRSIIRTGGVLVPNEKAGMAGLTGTVMRSGGTEDIPADELNEMLEDRAASMETGIGFTSGSASMNVLKEDFSELLPVFKDLLLNPAFPEEKIDLAKTQRKSTISRRNDNQGPIANREFRRLIYGPESVYGRNTEYETVDNVTREDIIEFHRQSFTGNNLMIGVVGDFHSDDMKDLLEEVFGEFPPGERTHLEFPEVGYEFEQGMNFVDKRDVNQSYVLLGHIGGMRDNPDYAKLQVMNRILSDGFSGRLMRIVRSQMGLAYAVFGSYGSHNFYPGTFTAGVMTQSSTTAEAIDAIIQQIRRLQEEPVSEEELQQTKDRFLNSLVFEYDSRASVLNERMNYDYAGLPPDTFDRLVEEIRAVTIEDVQQVAREYLRPDDVQILVVGNGEEIGDQLEKYGEVNEIDITIPEPGGDEEEEMTGDADLGREWLVKMANAVLPEGEVEVITIESENVVNTPQGEMELGSHDTLDFEENAFISEISTPMGTIVSEIRDGEGVMKMGGQEQAMQPQQLQQALNEYRRHYINLALNFETLNVEFIGETEKNGVDLVELRIRMDEPFTIYLDPGTALPYMLEANRFNLQMGERVTTESYYEDWQVADGVNVAYRVKTLMAGEEQSSATVVDHGVAQR
ncbi:MAG: pitrilysin family protein [Balneolaceae bacterium]